MGLLVINFHNEFPSNLAPGAIANVLLLLLLHSVIVVASLERICAPPKKM